MKYAIERFENNYAIVELDGNSYANIPKAALPANAREGDVMSIEIDAAATKNRKECLDRLKYLVWDNDNTLDNGE